MKFEVNYFSLLPSAPEIPFGNFKFFHLFSEDEKLGFISGLYITYGRNADFLISGPMQDFIDQINIKTKTT